MKTIITALLICYSFTSVLAQVDSRLFLISNKDLYKEIRNHNFDYTHLKNNPNHFPEITINSSLKGTFNACILILHLKPDETTHQAKSIGFGDSVTVRGINIDYKRVIQIRNSKVRKHYYSIIPLSSLYNSITSDELVEFKVHNKNEGSELTFNLIYSFFPGDSLEHTIDMWYGAYAKDSLDTKYYYTHRMVRVLRDPMYLALSPFFTNPNAPYEAEKDFAWYIMEGNFSMPFTIMQGRNDQSPFLRSSSVSVDPEFSWRITTEDSAPLLPLNTKVGISFHKSVLDNGIHTLSTLNDAFNQDPSYKFGITTYTFQIKHYSNGQEDSAANYSSSKRIPNFNSGNFSVNYLKFRVMRSLLEKDHKQISFGGFLQFNVPWAGYESDQKNKYGYFKLGGTWMLKSGPMRRNFFEFNTHHPANGDIVKAPSLTQNTLRVDLEISVPTNEYIGYENNPFRFMGLRFRYLNDPLHNRSIGWFTQLYYGRDYLNIRYNLVTFSVMAGFTFQFNKDLLNESFVKGRLKNVYKDYQREEMRKGVFNIKK